MKSEQEIYKDYMQFNHNRPWFFGKQAHWLKYLDTYQFAQEQTIEVRDKEWWSMLGMEATASRREIDEMFQVMRDALQAYYKNKK